MKKILCLTDFSQASQNAVQYAAWLSRHTSAELTLLHVVQTQALRHGLLSAEKGRQVDANLEQAEKELNALKTSLEADTAKGENALVCRVLTGEGNLYEVTEYYCEQYDFDAIIMGTTGGSADTLNDLLIGSNTVALFEKSRWPVFSIPRQYKGRQLHTIVFATDYQEKDNLACKEVIQFARPFCSQIYLLHVSSGNGKQTEEQLQNFAKSILADCGHDRIHFSRISDSDVERGVMTYSEEIGANLLVMTGKDPGFFGKFFKQSLTELAAYNTKVPLLVFPASWKPGATFFARHQ